MDQQVVPLLLDFKDILSGKASLLYSFSNAGGMNFWGVFFFNLASPFSFLAALMPKSAMLQFMNVLVMLKMAFSAFTFCCYERRHDIHPALSVLVSLYYAFSGFSLMYYQNLIWLDCMALFPLLFLSYEKLLKTGRTAPYIVMMSLFLVTSYYMTYMAAIFTILFFGLEILMQSPKRRAKTAMRFLLGSLASCLLTMPVWLPSLYQYASSARGVSIVQTLQESDILAPLPTTMAMLLPGAALLTALLYAGIHSPRNLKNIPSSSLYMLLLTLIPFLLEPVNKMWHVGSYMSFPVRFAYMPLFLLCSMAGTFLHNLYVKTCCAQEETPSSDGTGKNAFVSRMLDISLTAACTLFLAVIYLFEQDLVDSNPSLLSSFTNNLWVSSSQFEYQLYLVLPDIILTALLLRAVSSRLLKSSLLWCCLGVMLLGQTVNNTDIYLFSSLTTDQVESYQEAVDLSHFDPSEDAANLSVTGNYSSADFDADTFLSSDFTRVKEEKKFFHVNLLSGMGFHSLSHYTSLTDRDYLYAMQEFGYSSYWMECGGYQGTVLTDAFLNVAYTIRWSDGSDSVYDNGTYQIDRTPFCLPMGVISSASDTDTSSLTDLNRLQVQELLFSKLCPGEESPFFRYSPHLTESCLFEEDEEGGARVQIDATGTARLEYTIPVTDKTAFYFDCYDGPSASLRESYFHTFQIWVNDVLITDDYPVNISNGLLYLGTFENETIRIQVDVLKDFDVRSFGVYGLNEEKLASGLSKVKTIHLTQSSGTSLCASASLSQDSTIYVSLPYDEGWTLLIDGKKSTLCRSFMGFCSFTLPAGDHTVRMVFRPKYLGVSTVISLAVLAVLITVAIKKHRQHKKAAAQKDPVWLQQTCYVLSLILFVLVLALVYVIPMVLCGYGKIT